VDTDQLELIYEQQWSSYEEWGGVRIFVDQNDCVYVQYNGYWVMDPTHSNEWSEPEMVSWERALEIFEEWEQIALDNEIYWEANHWG
jgi:hypothetical protein